MSKLGDHATQTAGGICRLRSGGARGTAQTNAALSLSYAAYAQGGGIYSGHTHTRPIYRLLSGCEMAEEGERESRFQKAELTTRD